MMDKQILDVEQESVTVKGMDEETVKVNVIVLLLAKGDFAVVGLSLVFNDLL